jgi:hypothetical protein
MSNEGNDEQPIHFADCTCEHEPEKHSWGHCTVDGCDCEGGWEE